MKLTTITVFEDKNLDEPPKDPVEFMSFWQQKIDLIPQEYAGSGKINLEVTERWECGYLELSVTYERHETAAEEDARIYGENRAKAYTKERELEQLARLQEKYKDN